MADPRLVTIALDPGTIPPRTPAIGHERDIAIRDLLAHNSFTPQRAWAHGYTGPFGITLRMPEGKLWIDVATAAGQQLESIGMALGRFRRPIRDYIQVCTSHVAAMARTTAEQVEALDMARRALHNDMADALRAALAGKIEVDFETARRFFTLLCACHLRG